MAAFASGRRSTSIRFFIVLLALIMAFASVALPVYALSESVALFGLAAVLSAATAALGFKLTNNQQGIDTINRMCSDFVKSALAPALVVIGTRVNGLQNDMAYIKMQVANAKTYLDARVLAWVQKWLANNGIYETGGYNIPVVNQAPDLQSAEYVISAASGTSFYSKVLSSFNDLVNHFNLNLSDKLWQFTYFGVDNSVRCFISVARSVPTSLTFSQNSIHGVSSYRNRVTLLYDWYYSSGSSYDYDYLNGVFARNSTNSDFDGVFATPYILDGFDIYGQKYYTFILSNYFLSYDNSNSTGLSGTDTVGKDVIDLTLDQVLEKLKDWAPDWYDAGADSSTNSAVGAKDLPVTVPAGAATENPALNPDAVYNPPFDQPLDDTRSGVTSSTAVADGVTNANTAESSESAAATVSETQTIIDSLINWANNYISPDKGLFSKFPLCIPYDVYLLVSSALGVDARDISDIVNADTTDIGSLSNDSTAVNPQSDFVPVVEIQHDFNLDGYTYPIRISFDLTPYERLIKINRIFLSIALIAELIGSEYKRIRWGK